MKALAISGRGEAPALLDLPDPAPASGEVRVAVDAASVNGFDLAVAAGHVRDAMPHAFPVVLGRDFVGAVDAVGADVAHLHVGDRVAGIIAAPGLGRGAFGEFVTASAAAVTRVPEGVSAAEAAAVGLAAVAALDAVNALNVSDGDIVLVSGATGGVGSIAVQLAAARGATVIATARPGEEEQFVRSIGAAHAVDYAGVVDAAVRAVAPDGVHAALHAAGDPSSLAVTLRPGGRLASMLGASSEQVGRDDITVTAVVAHSTPEKLASLLDQVADARLRVKIAATVPLDHAADALAAFGTGTLGKVLITR